MKKTLLTIVIVTVMSSCTNDDKEIQQVRGQDEETLTRTEINTKIKSSIETTGDFNWVKQDALTIYSAVKLGDNILTVGYGESPSHYSKRSDSSSLQNDLVALIRANEPQSKRASQDREELYLYKDINVFDIKVTNLETIKILLEDSRVRYIEPGGYDFSFRENGVLERSSGSSSGCGYARETIAEADYSVVSPGAKVPWAFYKHNIPAAWRYSTGRGVTLAVIDTGLSPEQSLMNDSFNDGYSSGRFVQKYGSFIDSAWWWSSNYDGVNDKCGHGTSMASVATAPRNDDNLPMGVAYNANLVTYRAVENVVINDYHEKKGVSEALTALANRRDVKVISMSIGWPFSIRKIKDAVKYAYSKGKMIVTAGGTSTSFTKGFGVIFPATMNETVAVTGVKENRPTIECDVCHKGSKIDFTVQMERTNGTSNSVPVLSYYNKSANYVGGSSVATAITAGVATLVWSKNPSWSRSQVLAKMRQSAQFYPNKHSDFGYGSIDVLKAVK